MTTNSSRTRTLVAKALAAGSLVGALLALANGANAVAVSANGIWHI